MRRRRLGRLQNAQKAAHAGGIQEFVNVNGLQFEFRLVPPLRIRRAA